MHIRLTTQQAALNSSAPRMTGYCRRIFAELVGLLMAVAAVLFNDSLAAAEPAWDWAKERDFWAFRAPEPTKVPAVRDATWPRRPLDHFVLAKLEENALAPASAAAPAALLRRVSLDLAGLPPTPHEMARFLRDASDAAYDHWVNDFLSRSAFGERLASLWLPLARYAEDQAHQVGSDTKFFYPNAWRYRAWVIDAFNRDLAYDHFLKLQLAADRLGDSARNDLAALGFLGLGPKYYDRKRPSVMAEEWEDRVDTVCRTTMGLTVGCARCHDHKLEPITMADYYGIAGVFASTRMVNRAPDGSEEKEDLAADKRNPATLHVVADGEPRDLTIFERGNMEKPGAAAPRRFVRILSDSEPPRFTDGSGRGELIAAIASAKNPLTARVMVNRLWGLVFGRPLVLTTSNFGHSGVAPSHPELLDYLACEFVARGWSIKQLVREMVLSATYRQSCEATAMARTVDPSNALLSHMNRRRLTVEQWRDCVLLLTGELQRATDGPSEDIDSMTNFRRTVYARISRKELDGMLAHFDYPDANVHAENRSVSTSPMQKLFLLNSPFMIARARALAARVDEGWTTLAKLGIDQPNARRIEEIYRGLFHRMPSLEEWSLGLDYLRERPKDGDAMTRWQRYAQIMLASNELLYVD
ncbi:MAG: DUF1549 and DUF1553 domain-containing protein [Verrucomicrobiales bacterium]